MNREVNWNKEKLMMIFNELYRQAGPVLSWEKDYTPKTEKYKKILKIIFKKLMHTYPEDPFTDGCIRQQINFGVQHQNPRTLGAGHHKNSVRNHLYALQAGLVSEESLFERISDAKDEDLRKTVSEFTLRKILHEKQKKKRKK